MKIFDKIIFNQSINKESIKQCDKCTALCSSRTQVVVDKYTKSTLAPWESKRLPVMVIGEAPGETEDRVGMPFMGVSGKVLDTYLDLYDLTHLTYVTNIVKCRPENNRTPTLEEIKNCAPYLEQQIKALNPDVIVTLGKSAMSGLQVLGEISDNKSIGWKNPDAISYFNFENTSYPVIPIYHPSYYLRQKNMLGKDWSDFEQSYSLKFKKINDLIHFS
jgi:uracil-DNA glycosylase family 4